ncbi:MAG: amidohydrolase [Lachnospiraceae bacterium]|jgi:amidohydrolase
METEALKQKVLEAIDQRQEIYLALGKKIYENPETGYREVKTTKTLADALEGLGLKTDRDIAVTGCRAYANPDKEGPKVVIMGELDSVVCLEHPDCDKTTGAVHACGHNIQTTVMYGVADALISSGVMEQLDGKVDFMAVPAEEYIEMEYREGLRKEGKIRYFSGKAELTYRGAFDDTDMCMMVHNFPIQEEGYRLSPCNTGNGFIGKNTVFMGKQAHAGAAPWDGVNALNMASLAMTAMAFQRETFREADTVRVHQIINKGGDIVNAVPADVHLETTVRAGNLPALKAVNEKINRCIEGAAIAIGGKAVVTDMPGQMPLHADPMLAECFKENAMRFYKEEEILPCLMSTASFDIGDLSLYMPVLHGITSGITGGLHSKDYRIVSEEDAYIIPIKIMACTLIDLLAEGGIKAKEIKEQFNPVMSKEEYLNYLEDTCKQYIYGSLE